MEMFQSFTAKRVSVMKTAFFRSFTLEGDLGEDTALTGCPHVSQNEHCGVNSQSRISTALFTFLRLCYSCLFILAFGLANT
jgi:hypothetical protein